MQRLYLTRQNDICDITKYIYVEFKTKYIKKIFTRKCNKNRAFN